MSTKTLRKKFKKNENSIETFVSCPCSITCSCGTYDRQSMTVYNKYVDMSKTAEYNAYWG